MPVRSAKDEEVRGAFHGALPILAEIIDRLINPGEDHTNGFILLCFPLEKSTKQPSAFVGNLTEPSDMREVLIETIMKLDETLGTKLDG